MNISKLSIIYCSVMCLIIIKVSVGLNQRNLTEINDMWNNNRQMKEYNSETNDWIPQLFNNTKLPYNSRPATTKRLRLRKRKKRPPTAAEQSQENQTFPSHNSTQSFDNNRIHHSNDIFSITTPSSGLDEKSTQKMNSNDNINQLKLLLKQKNEGRPFSLSEFIQKRNISLAELLEGDRKAVNVLLNKLSSTVPPTTALLADFPERTTQKINKISFIEKQSINRKYEQLSSQEIFVEKQFDRIANDNNKTLNKTKVNLPITNSKRKQVIQRTNQRNTSNKTEEKKQLEGTSLRTTSVQSSSIDSQDVPGLSGPKHQFQSQTFQASTKITTPMPVSYETTSDTEQPKLKPSTVEEEIAELLKDQKEKDNLTKVLTARNMTIEELIEHRKRGSSKLHLADIFHKKTKEPTPQGVYSFEYPRSFRQPKSYEARENDEVRWSELPTTTRTRKRMENSLLKTNQSINEPLLSNDLVNSNQKIADNPKIIQIQPTKNVKSNLVASVFIVSFSFIVFVAILVTFKWIQTNGKLKYYNNNYSTLSLFDKNKRKMVPKTSFVIKTLDKTTINYYKNKNQDENI